jgi:hypothetical protein
LRRRVRTARIEREGICGTASVRATEESGGFRYYSRIGKGGGKGFDERKGDENEYRQQDARVEEGARGE